MPTPISKIDVLIDKQDTNEIVRDQIGAILAIEIDRQKDLAAQDPTKNPVNWDIDVYLERLRPWEANTDSDDGQELSEMQLVNISFDNDVFDNKGSDNVGNQKVKGTFYIDCYAHKNAYKADGVMKPGDENTSRDSDRVARIIRNILMAGVWSYLGLRGTVFSRYITRREKFTPSDREGKYFETIVVTRLTCEVSYLEYSPQAEGVDLELLVNTCKLGADGLITFSQNFDLTV